MTEYPDTSNADLPYTFNVVIGDTQRRAGQHVTYTVASNYRADIIDAAAQMMDTPYPHLMPSARHSADGVPRDIAVALRDVLDIDMSGYIWDGDETVEIDEGIVLQWIMAYAKLTLTDLVWHEGVLPTILGYGEFCYS
jgi:hypothetical protein